MARQRGIYAHLDGAQTWGYLKLDLKEIGCDSYAASAHKWFMGPKQVGVLYIRQERIAEVWPSIVSVGWNQDALTSRIAFKKFETLGQRDDGGISAVGTAVDFHRVIGAGDGFERGTRQDQQGEAGDPHGSTVERRRGDRTDA